MVSEYIGIVLQTGGMCHGETCKTCLLCNEVCTDLKNIPCQNLHTFPCFTKINKINGENLREKFLTVPECCRETPAS